MSVKADSKLSKFFCQNKHSKKLFTIKEKSNSRNKSQNGQFL